MYIFYLNINLFNIPKYTIQKQQKKTQIKIHTIFISFKIIIIQTTPLIFSTYFRENISQSTYHV